MEVEEPLLCIILNPNKRTKTGEAWEQGHFMYYTKHKPN